MNKIEKVLCTGKTHTTLADRERVNIELSLPGRAVEHQFSAVIPHPKAEELFAGAWSACFSGALNLAAMDMKIVLPKDLSIDIDVDLGQTGSAYFLQSRFNVNLPGLAPALAQELVQAAHKICPYSKAVHGNIEVATQVTTS